MIAVGGVVVLAMAAAGITVLSLTVARRPDRGAMLMVLLVASAGMTAFVLLLLGLLVGMLRDGGGGGGDAVTTVVRYAPRRLAAGLGGAATLLCGAIWLLPNDEERVRGD